MSKFEKFAVILIVIFVSILLFIGIWAMVYLVPKYMTQIITIHNETSGDIYIQIENSDNFETIKVLGSYQLSVKGGSTILASSSMPKNGSTCTSCMSFPVSSNLLVAEITDLYVFNNTIQPQTAVFELTVTNILFIK